MLAWLGLGIGLGLGLGLGWVRNAHLVGDTDQQPSVLPQAR